MNIVNLSGGKDSTFMLVLMLEKKIQVDRVLFADVGEMAEFEYIYPYLKRVEDYTGIKIETVRSPTHTARNMFYGYPSSGEHMDEIRGFPKTIGSACRYRSWLKVDPLEAAAGRGNDVYIGYAADPKEVKRSQSQEYAKGKKNRFHFPLIEWGITEAMCLQGLKDRGLYNELYDFFPRLGCFWCPKQPLPPLRQLWKHFPDKWQTIREMEAAQGREFKLQYPATDLEWRFYAEVYGTYKGGRRDPDAKKKRAKAKGKMVKLKSKERGVA